MLSLLYLAVKVQQYFESLSCMFLDKRTLLKIWLNPKPSFEEPGPVHRDAMSVIEEVGPKRATSRPEWIYFLDKFLGSFSRETGSSIRL